MRPNWSEGLAWIFQIAFRIRVTADCRTHRRRRLYWFQRTMVILHSFGFCLSVCTRCNKRKPEKFVSREETCLRLKSVRKLQFKACLFHFIKLECRWIYCPGHYKNIYNIKQEGAKLRNNTVALLIFGFGHLMHNKMQIGIWDFSTRFEFTYTPSSRFPPLAINIQCRALIQKPSHTII